MSAQNRPGQTLGEGMDARTDHVTGITNLLLQCVPNLLAGKYRPAPFTSPVGAVLQESGESTKHVYFLESGIVSLLIDKFAVGFVGKHDAVGALSALTAIPPSAHGVVEVPATGWVIGVDEFRDLSALASFRRALLVQEQERLAEAQRISACAAFQPLERRLAGCILKLWAASGEVEFRLTQEKLGMFLGVRRSTVLLSVASLKDAGLIDHRRGVIIIRDIEDLKQRAGHCYIGR